MRPLYGTKSDLRGCNAAQFDETVCWPKHSLPSGVIEPPHNPVCNLAGGKSGCSADSFIRRREKTVR